MAVRPMVRFYAFADSELRGIRTNRKVPSSDLHMNVLGSADMKAAGRFAARADDIERLLGGSACRLHHNFHPSPERRARHA